MEIKFEGEEAIQSKNKNISPKPNFLVRGILRLGLVKETSQAHKLSLILALILFVIFIISAFNTFSEEEIDEKYYYDPATDIYEE